MKFFFKINKKTIFNKITIRKKLKDLKIDLYRKKNSIVLEIMTKNTNN